MSTTVNNPVMMYTEQTPNPESLKFVTNRMLYRGTADFREEGLAKEWSPLAAELFDMPYVKGVYICNNFVTITKELSFSWDDLSMKLKEWLKAYIEEGKTILKDGFEEAMQKWEEERGAGYEYSEEDTEIVKKIRELIAKYVRPAVEMDGGNIEFKAYDQGRVTVVLQGSCSGCPSATMTLKGGIEGMLKRMIPEVTEVVAEMG